MLKLPNGYILEADDPDRSFLVYGELNSSGAAAKGWRLRVPNLSNATAGQKNELCRNLQAYLSRFDDARTRACRKNFLRHERIRLQQAGQ